MSPLRSWDSILWSSSPYGHKPPQRGPAASRALPSEGADPSFQASRTSLLSRVLSGFLSKWCTAEPHMQIVAGDPPRASQVLRQSVPLPAGHELQDYRRGVLASSAP